MKNEPYWSGTSPWAWQRENRVLGHLPVEFANVGGWFTFGDVAMDSRAQFLAVAEHRLIPARARYIGNQLRKVGYQSVWAPACQDPGGHAGVGFVSLNGAPLALLTGWVGLCGSLSRLGWGEWLIFF